MNKLKKIEEINISINFNKYKKIYGIFFLTFLFF